MNKWLALAATGTLALGVAACGDETHSSGSGGGGGKDLSGSIKIDGSSTVGPFAQAAAEGFQGENPNVKVSVGTSGTGGGFEKFCAGETDISDASRPIKDDEEVPLCKKGGVTYKEIQVANDGIAVVSNKDLKIDCLTTDQLKQLWNQGSKVKTYNELNPKFPAPRSACSARAPTPARSTSSPTRSTVRRASRARSTSRPRTTTCWSRASRATRVASATSASPTTSRTRTS